MALLLLNAARYRALKRMFGIGRADANLVTLVAAAAVVDAAGRGTARLTAPGAPAPANVALSAAAGGSALSAIAGTAIAGGGGGLLALAIVYKLARRSRRPGREPDRALPVPAALRRDAAGPAARRRRGSCTPSGRRADP